MTAKDLVHVVIYGGAFWGHARAATHYSIELCIRSPNLIISLLLPADLTDKAKAAFECWITETTSDADTATDVRVRINFVSITPPDDYECPPELVGSFVNVFKAPSVAFTVYWKKIHDEPQDLPRPSMLIVDACTDYEREYIKSINDVPILLIFTMPLNYFTYYFGPEESGLLGSRFHKALDTIADRKERDQELADIWASAAPELARTGDVQIHQYEHNPTRLPCPPGAGAWSLRTSLKVDGHIICSASWLEPGARKLVRSYFDGQLKKPTYCANIRVSTSVLETPLSPERLSALSPPEKEIISFLDNALDKYGPDSVLYLSFGTLYGPYNEPWQADLFIDVMTENKRPFVMSQASVNAIMNPGLEARIKKAKEAGLCATATWVPQDMVLRHKALGAFITHGGWNSTCESIGTAVPMIYWPFSVDQSFVASLSSTGTDPAAWQLYETRGSSAPEYRPYHFRDGPQKSGLGETIPVPTGTPEALRAEFERVLIREAAAESPELKKRKERMLALRERFIESTKPGGESYQAISDVLTPIGCTIRA
ncbi:unnamed protein product [Tilletia controversa]|nr:hypothetical protein CF336_g4142 [Tilletia laevis]KAE8261138.1 hypothetical protein A4X03_0g3512 [Tilletia caries]CAD6926526.1 unnamed protein product [Tilletia controversa]KAE8202027.1 hypothetical protein CF335_g3575 [Tilletia laevis]CAD6884753.1 unnamed protein product [Tilletia caries]